MSRRSPEEFDEISYSETELKESENISQITARLLDCLEQEELQQEERTKYFKEIFNSEVVEGAGFNIDQIMWFNDANGEWLRGTLLVIAIEAKQSEIATFLLEQGASPNIPSYFGPEEIEDNSYETALSYAIRKEDLNLVMLLLAKGANIETSQNRALTSARLLDSEEKETNKQIINLIVSASLDPTKNSARQTLLQWQFLGNEEFRNSFNRHNAMLVAILFNNAPLASEGHLEQAQQRLFDLRRECFSYQSEGKMTTDHFSRLSEEGERLNALPLSEQNARQLVIFSFNERHPEAQLDERIIARMRELYNGLKNSFVQNPQFQNQAEILAYQAMAHVCDHLSDIRKSFNYENFVTENWQNFSTTRVMNNEELGDQIADFAGIPWQEIRQNICNIPKFTSDQNKIVRNVLEQFFRVPNPAPNNASVAPVQSSAQRGVN